MRKEMHQLEGCLCEQKEDTYILLDRGDYTDIGARKDKYGLTLFAWGEGEAEYKPKYCPFCGKRCDQKGGNKDARVGAAWKHL